MTKDSAATIQCFRIFFPEEDPQSSAAYKALLARMFDFEIPDHARDVPFFAETEVFYLPDVAVSRVTATASHLTRNAKTIARSASDEVIMVCSTRGHFTYAMGNVERRVECGELAFFDLSQELSIDAPSVANVSLAISRRRLEALVPFLDGTHGLVVPPTALAQVLIGAMQKVIAAGAATQPAEARVIADALILMVGGCLDTVSQPKFASRGTSGFVSLASLKAAVERQLSDPDFGPQSLLDEFRMARSTLYRAFEPLGGVGAYINERRLRRAFRQMTNPALKDIRLSQLAFDSGFTHASAFTRSFKARFGLTPKEVRSLAIPPEGTDAPYPMPAEVYPYISPIVP
ncbi:helix-turn-helix domain-containing protein [Rhizobium alvei]|uniref:Helix-turn-helix domain-containing protein n=1 Tax=Rhizobium alvei TaxID=1132659 RepID=A0ABT8YS68_9HYPH|nr:helix-turn-helix domain-containing protein [Rhizobium alvei]MDO6966604.1 helix-turn-helix domain-containing protein [Rhizobium alvei]